MLVVVGLIAINIGATTNDSNIKNLAQERTLCSGSSDYSGQVQPDT